MRSTRHTSLSPISIRHSYAPSVDEEPLSPITKLELFLRSRGIRPAHLARESGYSRECLLGVRMGRIAPAPSCERAIVSALRRLSGEPVVPADVFDHRASRFRVA